MPINEEYLAHNPEALNNHNATNSEADYDKALAYWNHPMTDEQAKSLLNRIKFAFLYRNGFKLNSDKWRESTIDVLDISLNNIERTKKVSSDEYNIEADDNPKYGIDQVDTMPTASIDYLDITVQYIGQSIFDSYQHNAFYKCIEDSGVYEWTEVDPVDTSDANIIKAIDGVAIINSLLRINEIGDDMTEIANTSYNKILKAFINGSSYKNHTKEYILNGKTLTDVFPNESTDADIAAAKTKYINVITINTSTDDFNFESDDAAKRLKQKSYIETILHDISDIIKYVNAFTDAYLRPYDEGTHQNVTTAFDYYVLDYIVQMIEAENALFVTLLTKYARTIIEDPTAKVDIDVSIQHKQFNHAPFVGSMCNGACVGLCFGSCVTTCNGCGGCTSYCSSYCGASCFGDCGNATCVDNCAGTCKGECTGDCQGACTKDCGDDCSSSCITSCAHECKGSCTGGCSISCSDKCSTGCNDGCFTSCTSSCGHSCSGGAAAKSPSKSPQPANTKTINTNTRNNIGLYTQSGINTSNNVDSSPYHNR